MRPLLGISLLDPLNLRVDTVKTTLTDALSDNWRAQLRHAIRAPAALHQALALTPQEREGVSYAERVGMPLLIPPYYLSLCNPDDPNCPIRKQCVPTGDESVCIRGDRVDPLGEAAHEVAPRLIRRYPDRVLLLVTLNCAVHCRFCTRSRLVRNNSGFVSSQKLDPALRWLADHPEVREVLVSGGDPLVASTQRLDRLLSHLRSIQHLEIIRIGTRVPVVLPMRINSELVEMLASHNPLWVMTHFNHPKELTSRAQTALRMLSDAGLPVMNQTVMLRGINNDPGVLETLFRGLVRHRVRPYYLLHADVMEGTGHLRTALSQSIEIFAALQGRLSGIALPKLVVDTPGGAGKVPVGPETIVSQSPGRTVLRTFRGEEVEILDPDQA